MIFRPKSMRPANIRNDYGAVEGMPLTLLITLVVLAITVPLIFGSLRTYDRARVEASLISEIDHFTSVVQLIYMSGPGNSAVIDFAAVPGSMTGVDYVAFGDESGGVMASVIRYRIQNRPENIVLISSPNVPMLSRDGMEFNISSGSHRIRAECFSDPSRSPSTHILLELCQ